MPMKLPLSPVRSSSMSHWNLTVTQAAARSQRQPHTCPSSTAMPAFRPRWPCACPGVRAHAEDWLQLQMQYDLAQINQQVDRIQVTRFGHQKPNSCLQVRDRR